ncbi:hypothetical protein ABH19_09565 [Leptospirillum sp. Group II 'CF-1']|nr:hypothetical protein ABH19_09565 [Leptospirillum sp. Group II 'CF-1']
MLKLYPLQASGEIVPFFGKGMFRTWRNVDRSCSRNPTGLFPGQPPLYPMYVPCLPRLFKEQCPSLFLPDLPLFRVL